MTNKKPYNPLFEPVGPPLPNLGTGLEREEVISGKTSERIHKDVFGELSDKGLFDDIFGINTQVKSSIKRHTRRHGRT